MWQDRFRAARLVGCPERSYRFIVVAWSSQPLPVRVSDADRDSAIRMLREGSAQGRLSHDTFLHRVDLALRAREPGQLASLVRDLPPDRKAGFATRMVAKWSAISAQLQAAWRTPRLPYLVLPRSDKTVLTIGRAADSDLALPDLTVSWRHAELRRRGDDWVLVDLGSTNGTHANGWRVGDGFTVRPGDCVRFGGVTFRLTDRA
jgi:hypothetical protein